MRSTIDIDDRLLEEAMKLTKARTKKELVGKALEELIRKERIERLRKKLGRMELEISLKDLEKMRRER